MTLHSKIESFEETWSVDGLKIAGIVSGPVDGVRVLALHGWLDNASSFDALRAALPNVRLVAIDMLGHGLSDHRSDDSGYQIWDDLPQLTGLLDALGWEDCVLLGHSRGALIGALLAASCPERISAFITLDGIAPYPASDDEIVKQLASFIEDRNRLVTKPRRLFESVEDYVSRRSRSGEPANISKALAGRALRQSSGGYELRADPRLSGASAVKLNQVQIATILEALEMPVLNIWATPSERMKRFSEAGRKSAKAHISDLTTVDIAGHHHWHMDREPAKKIAEVVTKFLAERLKAPGV